MAFPINYQARIAYRNVPSLGLQPAVEVSLFFLGREAKTVGILDSGSTVTVFDEQIARQIGISDIGEGRLFRAATLAGLAEVYLFDVEMAVNIPGLDDRFPPRSAFGRVPGPAVFSAAISSLRAFRSGSAKPGRKSICQSRPEFFLAWGIKWTL